MCVWALRFLHNIFLPIISLLEKSPANLITTITLFSEIIFFLNPKKSPNIFLCHISLFWLCLSFHCPPVCVFLGCVFLVEEMFDFSYYNSIFWFLILFFFCYFCCVCDGWSFLLYWPSLRLSIFSLTDLKSHRPINIQIKNPWQEEKQPHRFLSNLKRRLLLI